ncbi:MAG: LysM peptidoglycan-binding domain-containing protein [Cytophagales bacterium]|nr:LysM peptidoglycan-binding domain-containing protein [Cytophagales bacterium]
MKKFIVGFVMTVFAFGQVWAKAPIVPETIRYADMTLKLNKSARKKVQESVNNLCKSPTHFQKYVDQADIFFPLIERVFKEQNFPDDIKYLIIQESAFRADAVSSSNAVGYWQFKKATGLEMDLIIKRGIDERKNIERATRAAAKYMTVNNKKLKNWVHALTSYNTGLGGVQKYVAKKDIGAKTMKITGRTHWYFLKFLAHKIAFENSVGKNTPAISLVVDTNEGGKTLKKIAKKHNVSVKDLEFYNKWLSSRKKVPTDKKYAVIIPVNYTDHPEDVEVTVEDDPHLSHRDKKDIRVHSTNERVTVNGVEAIRAVDGDNAARLAIKGGVTRKKFLKYNDLRSFDKLIPGEIYFIKKKKRKAEVAKHVVQKGERLWDISQKYGMRKKSLRKKNRMRKSEALIEGRVLWLRAMRPADVPIEYKKKSTNQKTKVVKTNSSTNVTNVNDTEVVDEVNNPTNTIQVVKVKKDTTTTTQKTKVVKQPNNTTTTSNNAQSTSTTTQKTKVVKQPNNTSTTTTGSNNTQSTASQSTTVTTNNNPTTTTQKTKVVEKEVIHTVVAGETLYAISKKYKVSVSDILNWNNLNSASLSLGQKLLIKQKEEVVTQATSSSNTTPKEKKYVYHIVQKGDTIFKISKRYKITPVQILKWNNKTSYNLSIGEKLIVKEIK